MAERPGSRRPGSKPPAAGEPAYRRLLRSYPEEFRAEFGAEMEEAFDAREGAARRRGGPAALARHWARTLIDLARTAPEEHMDILKRDLRHAVRSLARSPLVAAVIVITIALGIGATTAVFSVVDQVVLAPLPYPAAERLVVLRTAFRGLGSDATFGLSTGQLATFENGGGTLASLAAWGRQGATLSGADEPRRIWTSLVTADLFSTLGVDLELGRGFTPEEDAPGGGPVMVLGHALWRGAFGGDPGILGRAVRLDGSPHTVVGVLAAGGALPDDLKTGDPAEAFVPLRLDPAAPAFTGHHLNVLGRLRPSSSLPQARVELATLQAGLAEDHPDIYGEASGAELEVIPVSQYVAGDVRRGLLILAGAVALVLLIACSNVANLLLARGERRRREVAVRSALGAGRRRIVRQLLVESLVLAGCGAALGLAGARLGAPLLLRLVPAQLPRLEGLELDPRVLGFALGASFLVALAVGLVPALQASRVDLVGALREEARGSSGGPRARRLRQFLVIAEVAMTAILAIGAGLLLRSFVALTSIDPGMDPGRALTFRVAVSATDAPESADVDRMFTRIADRLRAVPGVEAVGMANARPLAGIIGDVIFDVEGRPSFDGVTEGAGLQDHYANMRWVSPGYAEALGLPLLRGRGFERADVEEERPLLAINRTFAGRFFAGEDPVGRRLRFYRGVADPGPWKEIVGVVADAPILALGEEAVPEVYEALEAPDFDFRARSLLVRAAGPGDPELLVAGLTAAVHEIGPGLPVYDLETMDDVLAASVARPRINLWMMGIFAALALLLAAVGLYGVMAYSVTTRTQEIGVRVALGARPRSVLGLVFRQALALVAIGLVLGTAGALALARTLGSLLHEVSPFDPATYAAVLAVLAAVALAATLLPGWQATRVDPKVALGEG
jgi:putative ABC transport system permease protein